MAIEQCFGLLKGRFRILKHVNIYNTEFITTLIIACCVLHNICIEKSDKIEVNDEEDHNSKCNNDVYDKDIRGTMKRNRIADQLFTG